MCLESGGSERLQGRVGGDGIIDGPPAHYQEMKSKCKRCTILWGLVGWGIGSDPKSTFGVLRWGWGGKLLVTVQVEKG